MVTRYPAAIDTVFTLKPVLDGQPVTGGSVEQLREAIIAIEDELGVKPSGVYATVRNRLDIVEGAVGNLRIIELEGDLGGTLETPKIIGIQGRPVSDVAPTLGQTYVWNGIAWIPGAIPADITFAGDLTGTPSTQTVVGINGTPVTTTEGASGGDVLTVLKPAPDAAAFTSPQGITTDGTFLWVGNNTIKAIEKVNILTKVSTHIDLTSFMPGGANVFPRKLLVNTNLSPYLFVACMDAFRVLVIDRDTNAVVGIGDTNGNRARSIALDNHGNIWVSTHTGGNGIVQRFVISGLISNFPNPVIASSEVAIAAAAEEITFDGTDIWAVGSGGDIDRISPIGNGTNTGHNQFDTSWYADVVAAFGAIWVLDQGFESVRKFVPGTFPSDPVDEVILTNSVLSYGRSMRASNGFLWIPDTNPGTGTNLFKIAVNPLSLAGTFGPPGDEIDYSDLVADPSLNDIYIAVRDATATNNLGVRTFDTSNDVFTTNYNKTTITGPISLHYAPGGGSSVVTGIRAVASSQPIPSQSSEPGWYVIGAFNLSNPLTNAIVEVIGGISDPSVTLTVRLFNLTTVAEVTNSRVTITSIPDVRAVSSAIATLPSNTVYQVQAQAISAFPGDAVFAVVRSVEITT